MPAGPVNSSPFQAALPLSRIVDLLLCPSALALRFSVREELHTHTHTHIGLNSCSLTFLVVAFLGLQALLTVFTHLAVVCVENVVIPGLLQIEELVGRDSRAMIGWSLVLSWPLGGDSLSLAHRQVL